MTKDFEEIVLSALLYEAEAYHKSDTLEEIKDSLKPFMFKNDIYRAIYESMIAGDTEATPIIHRLSDAFSDIKEVVYGLISNSDTIGIDIKKYASRIINDYVSNDVNNIIKSYEVDENNLSQSLGTLVAMIEKKIPDEEDNGVLFSDLPKLYSKNYFTKKAPRMQIGIESFDKGIGGLDKGDLHIIAARPSVGKSALSLQILLHNSNFKCGYFNMEMGGEQVFERLISRSSGIDMGHVRNAEEFLNDEESKYRKGISSIQAYSNIRMFNGAKKVSQIRNYVRKNKFDVIIVDYLQLIIPDIDRGGQRSAEVADISRGLKKIATDFNIPVIALSQLNRRAEMTKEKEPTMADIRESGAVEQDASTIIMLWAHKDENKRNLKVEKARQGSLIRTELYFNGSRMTFSEVPLKEQDKSYNNNNPKGFREATDDDEIPFN